MPTRRWMRSIIAFLSSLSCAPGCRRRSCQGWCLSWSHGRSSRRSQGWCPSQSLVQLIADTFNYFVTSSVQVAAGQLLHSHRKSQWNEEEENCLWRRQHHCSTWSVQAFVWSLAFEFLSLGSSLFNALRHQTSLLPGKKTADTQAGKLNFKTQDEASSKANLVTVSGNRWKLH